MKQKHLHSLLDTTFYTIGVVFDSDLDITRKDEVTKRPNARRLMEEVGHAPWGERPSSQKAYTYKVSNSISVSVDDFVVVHRRGTLCIGRVVRRDSMPQIDVDADFEYKWIVSAVDLTEYKARLASERLFADAILEIERVRQRELMLKGFQDTLPEGSEARALFERTVAQLSAPVVEAAPAETFKRFNADGTPL